MADKETFSYTIDAADSQMSIELSSFSSEQQPLLDSQSDMEMPGRSYSRLSNLKEWYQKGRWRALTHRAVIVILILLLILLAGVM